MSDERDKSLNVDYSVEGRRVRLVHTSDPYTDLRPGDEGTATAWNNCFGSSTLFVKWDKGNRLGLIEGIDRWDWVQ